MHNTKVKTVTARTAHRCTSCGEQIDAGTDYKRWRTYADGAASTNKMHPECLAMHEALDPAGEWEYDLYAYERPARGEYISEGNRVSHYAVYQIGRSILGIGKTPDEARASAAHRLDGGAETAAAVPMYCRRQFYNGDVVVIPCSEKLAEQVRAHGGRGGFLSIDGVLCTLNGREMR